MTSRQPGHPADEIRKRIGPTAAAGLLELARETVRRAAEGRQDDPSLVTSRCQEPVFGTFVTLRTPDGRLRGCIGTLGQVGPAAELVARSARSSALSDPRFSPVTPAESRDVTVEVSLLTPLEILDPDDLPQAVEVGRDGLVVEQGEFRGLLLPQVATEHRWGAKTFLEETCRKAGLPRDAWRRGAEVSRFAAMIIHE